MNASVIRLAVVALFSSAAFILVSCTTSTTVVYHNPLKKGIERSFLLDTTLLNPGAKEHPNKVDLTHWYTDDSLKGADTLLFLESYPKSEVDTTYHPSEYVAETFPIYHLSGSEDGRVAKIFLSDDTTFVIEPIAYLVNGYKIDLMVPFDNEYGFKAATVNLSWIDSLSRKRVIDHTPEAKQLARYALLGGLMMFVIIGSQNGLF